MRYLSVLLLACGFTLVGICADEKPKTDPKPSPDPAAAANQLTAEQKKEGWKLLFDGKSLEGWRGYQKKDFAAAWEVRDGAIFCTKAGPDLLTVDEFGDFELSVDWKIWRVATVASTFAPPK